MSLKFYNMNFETYLQQLQEKLAMKSEICGPKGCVEWRGGRSGPYGVMKLKFFRFPTSKVMRVHRVQYMITSKNFDLNPQMHVSHLCHNSLCINENHLSYETREINMQREQCKHFIPKHCIGHPGQPDCIF